MHRRQRSSARNRRRLPDGRWEVRARVERLGEPALLLLVSRGPTHGYQLLERLPALIGEDRVDVGNVYRALRALEDDGLVVSEWQGNLPGPAKRTYSLTDAGQAVLAQWLDSLAALRSNLTTFLDQAKEGGDHVPRTRTPRAEATRSKP